MSGIIYKALRIKFEKTGVAKYISHLDLMRVFSRSLVRAGVEVAHSEGFNPRPKIVFASAISLGLESLCEFADIKLPPSEREALEIEIYEKIKGVFPQGINIVDVYEPENDFKDIDRTRYHIFFKADGVDAGELKKLFDGDVFVEKKPGVNINLKDYICEINISDGSQEYILADVVVKTSQEMFLNPENIIKGVNLKFAVEDYVIRKVGVLDRDNGEFR